MKQRSYRHSDLPPTLNRPTVIANRNLHLSLQLIYFCPATCFSLARHTPGILRHLFAEAAALLPRLGPGWQQFTAVFKRPPLALSRDKSATVCTVPAFWWSYRTCPPESTPPLQAEGAIKTGLEWLQQDFECLKLTIENLGLFCLTRLETKKT